MTACDSPLLDAANARLALPGRRTGGNLDFAWGGVTATFTVGFSCYPETWRCAEVFLTVSKTQGSLEKEIRDAGILASFALQHGAALDALVAGVTHESDGAASSIVGTALGLVRAEIERLARTETTTCPAYEHDAQAASVAHSAPDGSADTCASEPLVAEHLRARAASSSGKVRSPTRYVHGDAL